MTILSIKNNILYIIVITGYYEEFKSVLRDQQQLNM